MNKIGVKQRRPVLREISKSKTAEYLVAFNTDLSLDSDLTAWKRITPAKIVNFHPESSSHRPRAEARAIWNDRGLLVRFDVVDRYVRALRTGYQDLVSKDSCVEVFLQPRPDMGYFNFEMSCIGTLLLYYIEDPSKPRPANGSSFVKFKKVPEKLAKLIEIRTSLNGRIDEEIKTRVAWHLTAFVPWALFEHYLGDATPTKLPEWRGNFFKCGDETSHPHWASWNPIGSVLRFHQPAKFGRLVFQSGSR